MEATVQRHNILQHPLGFFLVAVIAGVIWVAFPGDPTPLALLAVAVCFINGLRNPVWAIGAIVISQLAIPGAFLGPVSLRMVLLVLTGILLWRANAREGIQLGSKAKLLIVPIIIFILIVTVSDILHTTLDFTFKDFRYYLTGLLIAMFIPAAVRNLKDLKLLCGISVFAMTISVVVSLYQGITHSVRVYGISESTLQFSYLLGVVFLAIAGVLVVTGRKRENIKLLLPAFLMLPALYFTLTRSALFALFFGMVALFLFLKTRIRGEIILLVILGVTLFLSVSGVIDNFSFSSRSQENQDASSVTRKILWQTGLAIALDNPVLGIGGDNFLTTSVEYSSAIDPSLLEDRYWTYQSLGLGMMQVHNDFLKMWVYYGIIALIVFLLIFVLITRNFIDSFKKSKRKFIKGLAVGLAAGLIAYSINAFYHNALSTYSLFWLIAGFSLALMKLTEQETGIPRRTRGREGGLEE